MKDKYYPPAYEQEEFHCIICGVYAHQSWHSVVIDYGSFYKPSDFKASECTHCGDWTFWHSGKMIVPAEAPVEPHHTDLPPDCVPEYDEARDIFAKSPRASAALLRLCVQKLMPHLGESGKKIDDDIRSMVAKGLPDIVQQAFDFCRVVGNNAVHPGQIDLNDTPEMAQELFSMVNFIVEDRITRPKEIQQLYDKLPLGARERIEKRDSDQKS